MMLDTRWEAVAERIAQWLDELPVVLLASYGMLSGAAFLLYRADKSAAQQGNRRTGGWPGALLAQQVFRHKTIKQPFRTIFWVTVIANCLALAWFLYEGPLALP